MNYKEKYERALSRAREWAKNPTVWSSDDICQKIFPELAESEDEKIRKELINRFESLKPSYSWYEIPLADIISWLEKQKSVEWSEEDEKMLEKCIDKMSMTAPNLWKKEINWLKSLRPNHWKPTKEQMEALAHEARCGTKLDELYRDLQKL